MGLTTVRPGRLCDEVVAQVEALIASGEWPVGERIPPEPVLIDLYAGLTEALQRTVSEIDEHDDDPASFPGHEELAAAIEAGDPDAARAAADRYLDAARAIVNSSAVNSSAVNSSVDGPA